MIRSIFLMTLFTTFAADANSGGGCTPVSRDADGTVDEDGTTNASDSGSLFADDINLDWRYYDGWDGGTCIEMWFTNAGSDVEGWWFEVLFEEPIETVHHQDGGRMEFFDELMVVSPFEPTALASGDTMVVYSCYEPAVAPASFIIGSDTGETTTVDTSASTATDTTTTTTTTTTSTSSEPGLFATVADDGRSVLVTFDETDASAVDMCFDVTVGNLTSKAMEDWEIIVHLDERVELTQVDDDFFYRLDRPDELTLSPTTTTAEIGAYDSVSGNVCISPSALPVEIEAEFVAVEVEASSSGDDVDPPTSGVTSGGSPNDHQAPSIANVRSEREDDGLWVYFDTSETATGQVCIPAGSCYNTQTSGLVHRARLASEDDTVRIRVTDGSGNAREMGPFPL